jgi:hypothetical protein
MDSDAEMMERHARLLGRFADQAAMLAEDLCAAAMAAETAAEKQSLTLAFHRMGRTLRQTLALEAKLRRDARRDSRLDDDRADKLAQARTAARRDRVRNAVEQLIWTEAEDEQVDFLTLLNERLDCHDLADPDEPVEALIQRIAAEIGLDTPPPADPPPPTVILRSGDTPDPGDPSGLADPAPRLGSPASTCGRAEDDGERGIDDLLSDDYWRASG